MAAHGSRVPLWGDKNALELDSGDGGAILSMHQLPQNCALSKLGYYGM